jgi:hypothetical protein
MPGRLLPCLPAWALATFVLLFNACRTQDPIAPDAAFTPYIPAFTTGHISARSPILVRVAEGQRWRDTSETAIQQLFRLEPSVKGSTYWHDDHTLAFRPNERLEQDRTYLVRFALGKLIETPKGLEEFRFSVTTYRQGVDVRVTDMRSLSSTDRGGVHQRRCHRPGPARLLHCDPAGPTPAADLGA